MQLIKDKNKRTFEQTNFEVRIIPLWLFYFLSASKEIRVNLTKAPKF